MKKGISIIIPTCNGGPLFLQCLQSILCQSYDGPVQLIVVDSGSDDGTVEHAEEAGAVVRRIAREAFHHARTRNAALDAAEFDRVVFMVQDAIPCSDTWLSDLEEALNDHPAVAVYTDMIPHENATLYARFENQCIRGFRGQEPLLQGIDSIDSFRKMAYRDAYRTIAFDNVCAMYEKSSLVEVPFPEVDFAEDLAWSFAVLLKGRKILYQPVIKVKHSHNRPSEYGFRRQIVNSFWCARIMGRVERDMSSLTPKDLISLTAKARLVALFLRAHIEKCCEGSPSAKSVRKTRSMTEQIIERFSMGDRLRWFFAVSRSKMYGDFSVAVNEIRQESGYDISNFIEWLKTDFGATSREQLIDALEQITACALGRIYGEVYASHVVKGTATGRIEAFMRPYLHGV